MSEYYFADIIDDLNVNGVDVDIRIAQVIGEKGTKVMCQPPEAYLVTREKLYAAAGNRALYARPNPKYVCPQHSAEARTTHGITVLVREGDEIENITVTAGGQSTVTLEDTVAGHTKLTTGEAGEITFVNATSTVSTVIHGPQPEHVRGDAHFCGQIIFNGELGEPDSLADVLPHVTSTIRPDPIIPEWPYPR